MMDRITVVVDTREQEPYSFDSDKIFGGSQGAARR
jgi:hypothetical protein